MYIDDLLVFGKTQTEHDGRLKNLLDRLQHYGVLLNHEKSIINVTCLEFLGYELSTNGIRPTESKIGAFKSFRKPNNITELRSFLGMVMFVGKFIPQLADKTAPLRRLLRSGECFVWTDEHGQAFENIKNAIDKTSFLGYFNPKDVCLVIADSSPTGLGAVLLQEDINKNNLLYQPGATNLADAISRLSTAKPITFDMSAEACIYQLTLANIPQALSIREVENESDKDSTIQQVFSSLENGIWKEQSKCFKPFTNELSKFQGLLLRGDKLVMPESLRLRTLEIAHESHPGVVVMKRRLRQKVWWPLMDKQVEQYVKKCKACLLVSGPNPPELVQRTDMPDAPWKNLAADFVGPLPSGHNLLVIVDYYSRFTEVIVMKQTTASLTVQALHKTFCRFGMPESIKTDNGPQFISSELRTFCEEFGIQHMKTTPYWPQANGEVERMNRTIGKHLKISQETQGSDWQWDLRMFILMHNSTPHSTTGIAPSELMFGRVLKDKLPGLMINKKLIIEEIRDRDRIKKYREADYINNKRKAASSEITVGDNVVTKRIQRENKLSTAFTPEEFEVIDMRGSDVTLRSKESERIIHRNLSHLKKLVSDSSQSSTQSTEGTEREQTNEDKGKTANQSIRDEIEGSPRGVPSPSRPRRETRKPGYLEDYKINKIFQS